MDVEKDKIDKGQKDNKIKIDSNIYFLVIYCYIHAQS